MTLISRKSNKITGSIFVLFGLVCILYLFYSPRLILEQYSIFLSRYLKVIIAAYGGIGFIIFGFLYFIGYLVPSYEANPFEKTISNIFFCNFWVPIISALIRCNLIEFKRRRSENVQHIRCMFFFNFDGSLHMDFRNWFQ
jgi:hypothetical protein